MKLWTMRAGLALATAFTLSAHAQQFKIESANYGDQDRYSSDTVKDAKLKIAQRGNSLRVVDAKNNIVYAVELDRTEEQVVNPKLLELLRKSPGSRVIGNLIEKITISDIQTTEKTLTAKFNLYLRTTSVFGTVSAKLQIGALVEAERCEITRYDYTSANFREDKFQGTCLSTESGTTLELAALNTGLSSELNRALGMIGDLTMKLFSPMLSASGRLYETR